MAKDKDYRRMIHTARWVDLRKQVLTRHPLCQRCEEEGRVTAATEVHHVRPVESAVSLRDKHALMFAPSNLRALCHDCHVKTHTEMGRGGKRLTKERTKERLDQIKARFFGEISGGAL